MKYIIGLLLVFTLESNGSIRAQGFGTSQLLADWKFTLNKSIDGSKIRLDDSVWEEITVPHDWTIKGKPDSTLASCTGYLPGGIGWYRTTIKTEGFTKRYYLFFEGIYRNSEVFVNEVSLGIRPNGYVPFMYDITDHIMPDTENVVAVKVDHQDAADSRWYSGSGIYRNVYLIRANPVHLDLWGVYIKSVVDKKRGQVEVISTINNESGLDSKLKLVHRLYDAQRKLLLRTEKDIAAPAGKKTEFVSNLEIESPELWSVDHPNLYAIRTTVYDSGIVVEDQLTKTGFRTIEFDSDKGFFLNGENLKIKGVCLHHDAGVLGAVVPKEVLRYRLKKLKDIGVNAIRMSHNPQSDDLYDLCDEMGFLVMDEAFDEWEFPKKKWLKGWNVGKPGFQGYATSFEEWGETDLATMVKSHRNHPSIIMWSIGNEVDYPNDPYSHPVLSETGIGQLHAKGYKPEQPHADRLGIIAEKLVEVVKKYDQTRPVTAALAGAVMSNETKYPEILDVVGYNYTESRYEMDHEKYPERVFYGSETRHDLYAWKAVRDNDFIFGQFLWTGFDYLGEAGRWPSRGFMAGLIDFSGNIKARGYFRQSLWSDNPMVYLGTYAVAERRRPGLSIDALQQWNYKQGESIKVVSYTNCEEAELWLNNKIVGVRKANDDEAGMISWDLDFVPGNLKVKAYISGKLIVEDEINTPGELKKMKTRIISKGKNTKNGIALVELSLVDKKGTLIRQSESKVSVSVSGNADILGVENSTGNVLEVSHTEEHYVPTGKLLVYVKLPKDSNKVRLIFQSEELGKKVVKLL